MRGPLIVRLFLFFASLVGLAACADIQGREAAELSLGQGDSQKIFGGELVAAEDPLLDFVVAIEATSKSGRAIECTGTLVHPRVILTAAHCTEDSSEYLSTLRIRFRKLQFHPKPGANNQNNLRRDSLSRRAVQVRRPERWDDLLKNDPRNIVRTNYDLALVLLKEAAPGNTRPVLLLPLTKNTSSLPTLTAVGYGAEGGFIEDINGVRILTTNGAGPLRKVELTRSPREDSPHRFDSFQLNKGICYGDSGGPALTQVFGRWVQIGLASYVTHSPEEICKRKGFFLNIGYVEGGERPMANWISDTVEQLTGDSLRSLMNRR
jgi:hypothetical protein